MRGRVGQALAGVAVLQERPFRLFWLGRTSSAAGSALIPVALPFAVISVGGGVRQLGYVLAAYMLSAGVFGLAGGVWADRLPRRFVMIGCDVVSCGVEALTAAALLAGVMKWWMFVVTALLLGGAGAVFAASSAGFLPAIVKGEQLQQANALVGLSRSVTEVVGPGVSGIVVAAAGPAWVFVLDAVTFAASAAFLLGLQVWEAAQPVRQRFMTDLAEGWRDVRSRRWLSIGIGAFALVNLGLAPFLVLGPIIAERDLGGASAWGGIAAGGAVGGVLGAALGFRLRPSRPLLACFAVGLLAILPPLALLRPLPTLVIAAANAAFELGLAFGGIVWATTLQREIPADLISRVSGFDWTVSLLFLPLGLALAGPTAAAIGIRATLLVAVALIVLAAVGAMLTRPVRELRDSTSYSGGP